MCLDFKDVKADSEANNVLAENLCCVTLTRVCIHFYLSYYLPLLWQSLCRRYTVETTYNRPGYNRDPVITGIFKIPVFLPLCLCKIISPITGSQEAVIGYSRDFVADWRSASR